MNMKVNLEIPAEGHVEEKDLPAVPRNGEVVMPYATDDSYIVTEVCWYLGPHHPKPTVTAFLKKRR